MGGAFLCLRSFFKKEDGISVFWAAFSYFSQYSFFSALTKEDDDDDGNAAIR